ncbi:hypothetical protein PN499_24475 [Kamptonema animale CS-326]|nr:hypothetical protein [Kamptonema animale]MDB9514361.1 hypothetical protein [Kamptonema animale CS-326]
MQKSGFSLHAIALFGDGEKRSLLGIEMAIASFLRQGRSLPINYR